MTKRSNGPPGHEGVTSLHAASCWCGICIYSIHVVFRDEEACFRPQQDAAATRVSLQRQFTAPSVPARSQVYGYEEDNAGRLVMQPPPNQGHSGVGTDRPGPLDYDPDKFRVMKCSAATGWAKSKAERITAPGSKTKVRRWHQHLKL
jgi:hypothetical protein